MCYDYEWLIWEKAADKKREQAKPVTKETKTSPQPIQPVPATQAKPQVPVEAEMEPV
jgi:hypothetical protein